MEKITLKIIKEGAKKPAYTKKLILKDKDILIVQVPADATTTEIDELWNCFTKVIEQNRAGIVLTDNVKLKILTLKSGK